MPISSPIVTGESYTADDINNLRQDVLAGHTHDGTEGTKVPFSNLDVTGTGGSTAPATGGVSYDQIEAHIAASQGQHQLNASVYVAGSSQVGMLIQGGTVTFGSGIITFPVSYTTAPAVTVTGLGSMGGIGEYLGFVVTSVSTTQAVVVRATDEPTTAMWIAIGVKTA